MALLIIKANQEELEIFPADGLSFTLQELDQYVHGYCEIINLNNGKIKVINKDNDAIANFIIADKTEVK